MKRYRLPAEWEKQSGIQLTWPHVATDWHETLPEVERVYIEMAHAIMRHERLLVVTPETERINILLGGENIETSRGHNNKLSFVECPTNDTWARDHGFITLINDTGQPYLLDFTFNGWGMKFAANLDNQINTHIYNNKVLNGKYISNLDFVLEGGSIESDGHGTILTTSKCLLSINRNDATRCQIEQELMKRLYAERVLWLDYGYLAGDDTDSHIDTLARFCPGDTIAYVQCTNPKDGHYNELKAMEAQLQGFRTTDDKPYNLIPLPMADAVMHDGERLPATYANFLVINEAVLMPIYRQEQNDFLAARQLQKAFPDREIIGIDCLPLIRQHGSLHCCTMQFPENVIL